MANRNFFPSALDSQPEIVTMRVKFTAAADTEANGFTVNWGSKYVSAVTRTAEGKIKCAFVDRAKALVGMAITTTEPDITVTLENDSLDTTDPHVDIICKSVAASPAAIDPDAGVFIIAFDVANSGQGRGA